MKYSDLPIRKALNSSTDYIVVYDEAGSPFRISISDLKMSMGLDLLKIESIAVQYSSNKISWHSTYTESDTYMRIQCGKDPWSIPICIKVSAYETWKEKNGKNGTIEEFLKSLQGPAGKDADISTIKISQLSGYEKLMSDIVNTIDNKNATVTKEILTIFESINQELTNLQTKVTKQEVDNLKSVMALSETDIVSIKTEDGLRKITINTLLDNLAVKLLSQNSFQKVASEQRKVIALTGNQDGKNVRFSSAANYVLGTSQLYINGNRQVAGTDYLESSITEITLLTAIPAKDDILVFVAVPI